MNRGIMLKSARELLPLTLLLGLIVFAVEAILAYVLPTFSRQFSSQMMRVEFVRNIIKAMLGSELAEGIGPDMFTAIPWVHPVVLAVVWAHAIICNTRVPAGEVDRGTIDVLLGLPVSRWSLYVSESIVSMMSAVWLMLFAVIGNVAGSSQVSGGIRIDPAKLIIVVANLTCLYLVVGAAAWFASSLSDRRGRAMSFVFILVIISFLLNYLAQFWEPAQQFSCLGMLRYYRPLFILRDGNWPWRDLIVLSTTSLIFWTAGGAIFSGRDLSTL